MYQTHPFTRARTCGLLAVLAAVTLTQASAPAETDRVPERIILGITTDPAHSQTATWRTDVPVEAPQAQIALWTSHPKFGNDATTVAATAAEFTTGDGDVVHHYEATFTGLEAAKVYGYRVGDGNVWSEWFRIQTASDKDDAFRFIYLGDAQADVKSLWSRTAREAFRAAPDAALILHAGDLINDGFNDQQWSEWCTGLGFIGSMIPSLPVIGNHDMNLPDGVPGLPTAAHPLWKAHFALPKNGPEGAPMLEDEAYWVDYQSVRFIALEANAYSPEDYDPEARKIVQEKQIAWVKKLLSDNPNRWTIMLHHEPMYGVGKNADNPELRDAFLALYDQYKVDLVLQGHDHVYARSHKLAAGKPVADSAPGTVYVVSVSGPKMYDFNPRYADLMVKTLANTQLYQVIDVTHDQIQLTARTVAGEWVDGFVLKKGEDGNSTLIEMSPPETAPSR